MTAIITVDRPHPGLACSWCGNRVQQGDECEWDEGADRITGCPCCLPGWICEVCDHKVEERFNPVHHPVGPGGERACSDDCVTEAHEDACRWDDPCEGVIHFADPGGVSALRAASESNPRDLPCPGCGRENALTRLDRAHGYQCDTCARRDEGGF